jgi:hypothetical protein
VGFPHNLQQGWETNQIFFGYSWFTKSSYPVKLEAESDMNMKGGEKIEVSDAPQSALHPRVGGTIC